MIKQEMAADAVDTSTTGAGAPAQASAAPATTDSGGMTYGLGALGVLVVGWFVLGIPCALLAFHLSNQAIKRGSAGFGTLMKVLSLLYLGVLIIGLFLSAGRP